ncbi:unnamed protein product [Cylicocyclus nassatus]|uniref:Uncharacterized protein n=1 Tax=Cylicocyclus nassatus TaxID=53992 RepID=A0AA36GTN3_CYLNA|nr:unnamed protein product [Cylicocyclus nassatus]
MNLLAVQKERGPRSVAPHFAAVERCRSTKKVLSNSERTEVSVYSMDDLFVAAVFAVSHSVLLAFATSEERRELLVANYSYFLALAISTADEKTRRNVQHALPTHVEMNSEEFRLSVCVLLCKLGSSVAALSFAPPLLPIYTHWIRIHCTSFSWPGKADEILELLEQIWHDRTSFDHLLSAPATELIDRVFRF